MLMLHAGSRLPYLYKHQEGLMDPHLHPKLPAVTMLEEIPSLRPGPVLLIAVASVYILSFILHRLLLHPLRTFPGPKLGALSRWHWAYHAKDPDYIHRLHKIYGNK